FAAYARACRLNGAFDSVRRGGDLDEAVFSSGFESHSGMREAFRKRFGSTPGAAVGKDAIRLAWLETPLGPMIAGAVDAGLCLLEFTDRRMLEAQLATLRRRFRLALTPGAHPHLVSMERELAAYFAGKQ